jgi:hypothetical protein
LGAQYDYFDDGRDVAVVEGMSYKDSGTLAVALTHYLTDQAWIRVAWMMDDRGLLRSRDGDITAPEHMGVLQTMLSF